MINNCNEIRVPIEIMETDITNLIKETQELPKKLRIQVKLKYMAIGMIISAIISIILIIILKYTGNSFNKALLNLFISNSNEK